jgi:hypothetical protein
MLCRAQILPTGAMSQVSLAVNPAKAGIDVDLEQ